MRNDRRSLLDQWSLGGARSACQRGAVSVVRRSRAARQPRERPASPRARVVMELRSPTARFVSVGDSQSDEQEPGTADPAGRSGIRSRRHAHPRGLGVEVPRVRRRTRRTWSRPGSCDLPKLVDRGGRRRERQRLCQRGALLAVARRTRRHRSLAASPRNSDCPTSAVGSAPTSATASSGTRHRDTASSSSPHHPSSTSAPSSTELGADAVDSHPARGGRERRSDRPLRREELPRCRKAAPTSSVDHRDCAQLGRSFPSNRSDPNLRIEVQEPFVWAYGNSAGDLRDAPQRGRRA